MNAQPQPPDVEQRPTQSGPQPQPKVVSVPPPRRSRRPLIVLLLLMALGTAGYFVWQRFFAVPPVPDSIVVLSGRIEGDDSAVSPKTTGRILEIRFREGDSVKAGDIIATLDDQQVRAREEQATAALQQALARSKSAQDQVSVLEEQLRQGEAEVAQQDASYKLALWDEEAYTRLAKNGAVSERQGKQAQSTAEQQRAALAAARRRVAATQMQIAQQHAEIASANATTQQARAQLAEAQANRQDLIVKAPFSGTVATRTAEPGEVVTAGTAVITLVDLNQVYLRGFVPEGQIGKIKLGQPAHVYLDSNPTQPLDAQVSRIDPKATFTPENTYFRDDRVKQVVGLKLQLKAGFGYAKPGMPADGEILVSGDRWPQGRWRK
ncbi:MAG TPA: HlyD family efflux transporter periplasmic adaptor subunit [Candidatus Angelobacter sp.]